MGLNSAGQPEAAIAAVDWPLDLSRSCFQRLSGSALMHRSLVMAAMLARSGLLDRVALGLLYRLPSLHSAPSTVELSLSNVSALTGEARCIPDHAPGVVVCKVSMTNHNLSPRPIGKTPTGKFSGT